MVMISKISDDWKTLSEPLYTKLMKNNASNTTEQDSIFSNFTSTYQHLSVVWDGMLETICDKRQNKGYIIHKTHEGAVERVYT